MFAKSYLLWVTSMYLHILCIPVDILLCAQGGIGAVAMSCVVLMFSLAFSFWVLWYQTWTKTWRNFGL